MPKVTLVVVSGTYGFEAKDENGHIVKMDMSLSSGGTNTGTSPMVLLLEALAGCASIDVIMILKKMKVALQDYKVVVSGEREKDKEPALWKKIHLDFYVKGDADVLEKVHKAVNLSMEKYCSVAFTLRAAGASITHAVVLD